MTRRFAHKTYCAKTKQTFDEIMNAMAQFKTEINGTHK